VDKALIVTVADLLAAGACSRGIAERVMRLGGRIAAPIEEARALLQGDEEALGWLARIGGDDGDGEGYGYGNGYGYGYGDGDGDGDGYGDGYGYGNGYGYGYGNGYGEGWRSSQRYP
jgi:hypothetical protein